MFYVIIGQDVPNSLPLRKTVREAHLERLNALKEEGKLLLAGPFPAIDSEDPGENGFTGSLIVAEFNSLKEAQTWVNNDPYVKTGVYAQVEVKPFRKVLP